jgi:hypothetical protein
MAGRNERYGDQRATVPCKWTKGETTECSGE